MTYQRTAQTSENGTHEPAPVNKAADNMPYFTPAQIPAPGTALNDQTSGKPIPKLFTPIKIRGLTMQNRIWVSPMCQYSAHEGFQTPWHLAHYGSLAQRGVCNKQQQQQQQPCLLIELRANKTQHSPD
jgi:hypothetical protein